jgi:hypothetical protein
MEQKKTFEYPKEYATKSFENEIEFEILSPEWEKNLMNKFENLKKVEQLFSGSNFYFFKQIGYLNQLKTKKLVLNDYLENEQNNIFNVEIFLQPLIFMNNFNEDNPNHQIPPFCSVIAFVDQVIHLKIYLGVLNPLMLLKLYQHLGKSFRTFGYHIR